MLSKQELLPCPFCGETQIKLMEWPADATICEIFCLNCKSNTGAKFTKKEAIKHWNTRTSLAELTKTQQALDTAREALESVNELWNGDKGFEEEKLACAQLKCDSPVFTAWKKVKAALEAIG